MAKQSEHSEKDGEKGDLEAEHEPIFIESFPRTDSYDVALLYIAWEMTKRTLAPGKNGLYDADTLREQIHLNMHTLYDAWDNRNKKLDPSIDA